jgi:xanthine/CO dehydrogenase XdhC/CoxF family maturation factor
MTTAADPAPGQELGPLLMPDLGCLEEACRTRPSSPLRFGDDGQYRIEIPSVEGPDAFEAVLEEAGDRHVIVHRVSQGTGITLLTDAELRGYASLGAQARVEACLFVGPRAPWDGNSAAAFTQDGRSVASRHVGVRALLVREAGPHAHGLAAHAAVPRQRSACRSWHGPGSISSGQLQLDEGSFPEMPQERIGRIGCLPVFGGHRADVHLSAQTTLGFPCDVVEVVFLSGT